ncbi:hypothetical protein PAXINDRAFT_102796 [Paxillus involutus ATCC 200175]|uniref:WW domain-containing protein n=1 Tax=Paxillus involutus ATCC 200175 TaxID=664439 RepID=A0A0C9TKD5_PAXIN|nr:hypothetical protein PAXINDRAFT_102796 [Paxillus involutus ATCC 200175]
MASPAQQLPPGWAAEWDPANQRYLFIETATGRTQWELPEQVPTAPIHAHGPSVSPPPMAQSHGKRRQCQLRHPWSPTAATGTRWSTFYTRFSR